MLVISAETSALCQNQKGGRAVIENENTKPFVPCVRTCVCETKETLFPDVHTQELLDRGKAQWGTVYVTD